MPKASDYRLSVQLVAKCDTDPIATRTSHEATLDNHTAMSLYDVTFTVEIANWSQYSRLDISRSLSQSQPSGACVHTVGAIPTNYAIKETFDLVPKGGGVRREAVVTNADWTLEVNSPLTGLPSARYSRSCHYTVGVG